MAAPQTGKVLRLGIFQGDRCIEERLIRKRIPITIGQTLSNTFVIPASTMPKSYLLFDLDPKGQYVIKVNDRMGGRLSLGNNEVIDLTRLRHVDQAKRSGEGYDVALGDKSRGKVTIGETRILFQFVTPPSASSAMLPTALGGGAVAGFATFLSLPIIVTLVLSGIIQLGPLFFVMLKDWPEPENINQVPDWYLEGEAEVFEDEEEDEEEKDEGEEPEEEIEGLESEIPSEEPSLVPDDIPDDLSKSANDQPKSDEKVFEDKARGKKLAAELFGVEGGESLGASITAGITGDSVANLDLGAVSAEDFGAGTGGEGLGLGSPGGGSAGGEPGLKGPAGGGDNKAIGVGPGPSGEQTKREKIKFKISDDTKIPESVGKADKKSMEGVFRKKRSQIEKCYRRVIQKYGAQPGKLVVKITIGGDGKVMKVNVTADEVKKGLADCVTAKINRWKFPATGKPVSVFKRWVFS